MNHEIFSGLLNFSKFGNFIQINASFDVTKYHTIINAITIHIFLVDDEFLFFDHFKLTKPKIFI